MYIIKGTGKINDIATALKTLRATYGKGATLADVMRQQTRQAIDKQLIELKKDVIKNG